MLWPGKKGGYFNKRQLMCQGMDCRFLFLVQLITISKLLPPSALTRRVKPGVEVWKGRRGIRH